MDPHQLLHLKVLQRSKIRGRPRQPKMPKPQTLRTQTPLPMDKIIEPPPNNEQASRSSTNTYLKPPSLAKQPLSARNMTREASAMNPIVKKDNKAAPATPSHSASPANNTQASSSKPAKRYRQYPAQETFTTMPRYYENIPGLDIVLFLF